MAASWKKSKEWADKFMPEIENVVRQVAGRIISIRVANQDEDQSHATDYVVTVASGDIACRVREHHYWRRYGDMTLRCSRPSGHMTELEKVKKGWARWYLYAWEERFTDNKFVAWMFVDLDTVRQSGLLNKSRQVIENDDRSSGFVYIGLTELWQNGCIIGMSESVHSRILQAST